MASPLQFRRQTQLEAASIYYAAASPAFAALLPAAAALRRRRLHSYEERTKDEKGTPSNFLLN